MPNVNIWRKCDLHRIFWEFQNVPKYFRIHWILISFLFIFQKKNTFFLWATSYILGISECPKVFQNPLNIDFFSFLFSKKILNQMLWASVNRDLYNMHSSKTRPSQGIFQVIHYRIPSIITFQVNWRQKIELRFTVIHQKWSSRALKEKSIVIINWCRLVVHTYRGAHLGQVFRAHLCLCAVDSHASLSISRDICYLTKID